MDASRSSPASLWMRKHGVPALAVAASLALAFFKINRPPALTWGQVLMPIWGPLTGMIVIWAIGMVEARIVCLFQDTFFPVPAAIDRSNA